ncbi:hypothetical protein BIV60_20710 [Bacillus sp. MUM 116]|nr:hypothetical protein BIV60_20710 [Bacillus sp. MUM 116]
MVCCKNYSLVHPPILVLYPPLWGVYIPVLPFYPPLFTFYPSLLIYATENQVSFLENYLFKNKITFLSKFITPD